MSNNLVVFNGGLMRGLPSHWKIEGTTFLEEVQTAPRYWLFSIGGRYPAMLRDDEHGASIAAELYRVPDALWPRIRDVEPTGLYHGPVELADGRLLEGMLGEAAFIARFGEEITEYGGWRAFLATQQHPPQPEGTFELFVNGTLMRGLALNANLKGATFLGAFSTEPRYRIHSIGDVHPGMYRLEYGEEGGVSVPGELYRIADAYWPAIEAGEPPGLYRGRIFLEDGHEVWGILFPRDLAEQHPDISPYGGWRTYVAAKGTAAIPT